MDVAGPHSATPLDDNAPRNAPGPALSAVLYADAFLTGAIVMSFEMLGSRYLNPYFGSGIYTWAALISTVLAALTAGYFLGGLIADRTASATLLGTLVAVASLYLVALPSFAQTILEFVFGADDNVRTGSLFAALAIMFPPVMMLGVYSPFAIRLLLRSARQSGSVSGAVYGISTAGSIVGTLGTTFFLIPLLGTRAITLLLGAIGIACGLALIAVARGSRGRATVASIVIAALALVSTRSSAWAAEPFDEAVRAAMLKQHDGQVAHVETEYNDLFITKTAAFLAMATRVKSERIAHSTVNLKDPDDLPIPYTSMMTAALLYPESVKRILMVGLGAGSISTYLTRAMPDATIDVVELDGGVIAAGEKYFGLRQTDKVRFIENDGRVFLNRHKEAYDLIILDAFRELGVPFHLLTREFYTLLKDRLAPGGAAAFNVTGGTKLTSSTLLTLRAVFPTVDVYPVFDAGNVAQVIAVATSAAEPSPETLTQRASALQEQHRFRYPLPGLAAARKLDFTMPGGALLTDDFSPVNLYETMPAAPRRQH
jgi:spermidine synthase